MRLFLSLLMMASGCSSAPERVVERRLSNEPAARGDALLRSAMIAAHGAVRIDAGAAPITWDATLATDALVYAQMLARSGRFEHSKQTRGATPQGENLWTGTRAAYSYAEMAGHWAAEKRYYRRAATPGFSTTGRWSDVAHYTQMIWHGTPRFGCAVASNVRDDYLVCRYTPPGNVVGQVP